MEGSDCWTGQLVKKCILKEHFELWWWNRDVDVAVCRMREPFRIWK